MSELKPCPFCGGKDLRLESFSGWGNDVIICYDCLAIFSQSEITCEEDLIKAWNRRTKGRAGHTNCTPESRRSRRQKKRRAHELERCNT